MKRHMVRVFREKEKRISGFPNQTSCRETLTEHAKIGDNQESIQLPDTSYFSTFVKYFINGGIHFQLQSPNEQFAFVHKGKPR